MHAFVLDQEQCPLCASRARTLLRHGDRRLRRCATCRFAWVPEGLMRLPDGQSIYEGEVEHFDDYADYYRGPSAEAAARDKVAWVRRHAPSGARLLDVGANFGYFVHAAGREFDALGLEPSPQLVTWGTAHLGARLELGSVYDVRPDLAGRFEAVTLFDVIEHLPDPHTALDRCGQYLAPGGRLFITTPDAGSVMARVLGAHWYYVDLTQHIALFTRANLTRVLGEAGYRVIEWRTIGRDYQFSYILNRLDELSRASTALRAAHTLLRPLSLWPDRRIRISLGDVMGVVAERI